MFVLRRDFQLKASFAVRIVWLYLRDFFFFCATLQLLDVPEVQRAKPNAPGPRGALFLVIRCARARCKARSRSTGQVLSRRQQLIDIKGGRAPGHVRAPKTTPTTPNAKVMEPEKKKQKKKTNIRCALIYSAGAENQVLIIIREGTNGAAETSLRPDDCGRGRSAATAGRHRRKC